MSEKISFKTDDGVTIVGDYYAVESAKAFALLLHMMPATKEAWIEFATALTNRGIASLAIDERGHGESTEGGKLNHHEFTDQEQQMKIHDVRGALSWLADRGATDSSTVVVGGSIGANLTIKIMGDRAEIKTGVALSPGLNYRGVKTDKLIKRIADDQKILLVASDNDTHGSFECIRVLNELRPNVTDKIEERRIGHANDMLDAKPELIGTVVDWIEKRI
ncbi:MAG: alpha/beta hydrolase [Candidatus Uhrbacteria bacterium]